MKDYNKTLRKKAICMRTKKCVHKGFVRKGLTGMKLKENIIKFLNKHEKMKYWACVFAKSRDKDFVNHVLNARRSVDFLATERRGDNHRGIVFYDLKYGALTGFFSMIIQLLNYFWFADSYGMIPIVTITDSLYKEKDEVNGSSNPWEYYFKQYRGYSTADLTDGYRVVPFREKDFTGIFKTVGEEESFSYRLSEGSIEELGYIYSKYIVLNDIVKTQIDHDIASIIGEKKTLGVQIRRGDMLYAVNNHPVCAEIEEYIAEIELAIEKGGFEQIFVAAVDKESIEAFKDRFGDFMVTYQDVERTTGLQIPCEIETDRIHHRYLSGFEVLRDVYTLKSCPGFVSGLSNVSMAVRIMKAGDGKRFEYIKIIDKGINHNKLSTETVKKRIFKNVDLY